MNPFRKAAQNLAGQFARELVGAAFDAVTEKIQERSERAPFSPGAPSYELPRGAHLSRFMCPECAGPFFFMRNDSGDDCDSVVYWCPSPKCGHRNTRSPKETAAREGASL
jgi:hypothetical protein